MKKGKKTPAHRRSTSPRSPRLSQKSCVKRNCAAKLKKSTSKGKKKKSKSPIYQSWQPILHQSQQKIEPEMDEYEIINSRNMPMINQKSGTTYTDDKIARERQQNLATEYLRDSLASISNQKPGKFAPRQARISIAHLEQKRQSRMQTQESQGNMKSSQSHLSNYEQPVDPANGFLSQSFDHREMQRSANWCEDTPSRQLTPEQRKHIHSRTSNVVINMPSLEKRLSQLSFTENTQKKSCKKSTHRGRNSDHYTSIEQQPQVKMNQNDILKQLI